MNVPAKVKYVCVPLKKITKYKTPINEVAQSIKYRAEVAIRYSYAQGVADAEKKFRKTLKTLTDSVKLNK